MTKKERTDGSGARVADIEFYDRDVAQYVLNYYANNDHKYKLSWAPGNLTDSYVPESKYLDQCLKAITFSQQIKKE